MGTAKLKKLPLDELLALIKDTRSKSEALQKLGVSPRNSQAMKWLRNFIKTNEVDISHHSMGVPLSTRYSREDIVDMVNQSICWTGLMGMMGIRFVGSNIHTVKKLVEYYKIPTDHFDSKKAAIINRPPNKRTYNEIFCENSTVQRSTLKERIIVDKLLPYVCNVCFNNGTWNGKQLVLHIEHKNGVNNDNRLDNLCFLCPNCHSQTSTYAGRNNKSPL